MSQLTECKLCNCNLFFTSPPELNSQSFLLHLGNHSVTQRIKNCESVLICNLGTPTETFQSSIYFLVCEPSNLEEYVMKYLFMFLFLPQDLAIWMALVAASISPTLLVGGPSTGSPTFLIQSSKINVNAQSYYWIQDITLGDLFQTKHQCQLLH